MKLTKKLTIFLASLFLCMGLFIATGTTSQAASSIPSKARVYPKNISDVTFTLPKYNMEVRNVKSNNKNMIAKYTYGYSHKDSSEERGNATISVYTKKEGSYKLSFDLYLNGKKKSSHTITIYSKSDSPIKKITFNGKPWYEAKTSYTNAKSGTVKVVLNKGYKLKKLEVKAFSSMNYVQTFTNSLIITVLSIVFIILFAVMCAYFFARNNWKINKIIFSIMVTSMIIPFQTIMIPVVRNFSAVNAVDNIFMVVVFYVGAHISMAVFMFQGFIKGIPVELDEAATIDGCGQFQILFKIVFPLLKPIISTVAVLDILAIWNDFLLPYILLQSNRLKTLPLMTYSFFGQYSVDYSLVCSGLIMSILPVIIIYIFLQKQIIEGVVAGAIK